MSYLLVGHIGVFLAVVGCVQIQAQTAPATKVATPYAPPKTAWGDPDLQGIWPSTSMIQTPLERDPKLGTRTVLNDEELAKRTAQADRYKNNFESDPAPSSKVPLGAGWADYGKPNRQASLVVDPPDGRIPPLTAEAQEREKARLEKYNQKKDSPDSWEDLTTWDRCITLGPQGAVMPFAYNNGNEILQVPGYVVFRNEMIHEARIIPLDGRPHVGSNIRSWMGDSRGHWEGNTLVVDTTNLNGKIVIGNGGGGFGGPSTVATENLHLTERFTRLDADTLQYSVTIDDPQTWTKPWTISFPLRHEADYTTLYEYACHEGNIFMHDALAGARTAENKNPERVGK